MELQPGVTLQQRATVMLTVKSAPEIGRTRGETVCVAGIRLDGANASWIRLFPVKWEWFWHNRHPKYQLIAVNIAKHQADKRPESYRPDLETVQVIRENSSLLERACAINNLPQYTMCDLVDAKGWDRPSLGLVVPRQVHGFVVEDHSEDASHIRSINRAAQTSLIAPDAPPLEHCPLAFKFYYDCMANGCNGHEQTIVDWEVSEAWRKWRKSYPGDYLKRIEDKWMGLVNLSRKPAFFIGNQHQAPQGFLVLGIARDVKTTDPAPVSTNMSLSAMAPEAVTSNPTLFD